MTKRELLNAMDDIHVVVEALPVDVDILSVQLDCMRLGCVRMNVVLRDGIKDVAAAFGISELETLTLRPELTRTYFTVGSVSVIQYGKERTNAETP